MDCREGLPEPELPEPESGAALPEPGFVETGRLRRSCLNWSPGRCYAVIWKSATKAVTPAASIVGPYVTNAM